MKRFVIGAAAVLAGVALALCADLGLTVLQAYGQDIDKYSAPPSFNFRLTGYGATVDEVTGACTQDTTQTGRWDFFFVEVEVKRADWRAWQIVATLPREAMRTAWIDDGRAPQDSTFAFTLPAIAPGIYQCRVLLSDEFGNASCYTQPLPFALQPNPLDVPSVWLERSSGSQ